MAEKIAVITGCSSGIGLLTAVEFASRGMRVVATMRDLARRGRLDEAARKAGVADRLDVRRLDVTETSALTEFVDGVMADHGRIDTLVNNAGFAFAGFAEDLRLQELRQQMETNFFGQIALTQAVLPVMRRQRSGHIIMVSSETGRVGEAALSAYCASKFALEGWSETLRLECRALGIQVVLVEPGAFETDVWDRNVRLSEVILAGASPNQERGRRVKEWAQNAKKADARIVARLIARIAENPRPRLRYVVGSDAHMKIWLRALLPWRLYEKIALRAVGLD